jgi:hypothetical protein
LPKGKITLEAKNIIDPAGQGNLVTGVGDEKRTPEELMTVLDNPKDLPYMHKIVSNSAIMKFPVQLRKGFNID